MGRRLTAGGRTERRSTFFCSSYLSMLTLRAAAGRATALLAILVRSGHHVGGRVLRVLGLPSSRHGTGVTGHGAQYGKEGKNRSARNYPMQDEGVETS